jgi:hypothetical protein
MFREMEMQPSLEKAAAEQAVLGDALSITSTPPGHARESNRCVRMVFVAIESV